MSSGIGSSIRGTLRKAVRAALKGGTVLSTNPKLLFSSGAQGIWIDPSDMATMFQDSAGTTPVTAAGQPVGKILDKSGRGNHLIQATAAARPTLQQDGSGNWHLLFDGTDDSIATAGSVDFSGTNKLCGWAAVYKASDAAAGIVCEFGNTATPVAGSFGLFAPTGATQPNLSVKTCGTTAVQSPQSTYPAPTAQVLTFNSDIGAPFLNFRISGVDKAAVTTSQGTGNFGMQLLSVGRRSGGTQFFNGRLYGLILRGAAPTNAHLVKTERWLATKAGIPLL